MKNFEVSFNSPQCGWMSIGFKNNENEFHSTTAYTPYEAVLSEILDTLAVLLSEENVDRLIKWNRLPEEFDFVFKRSDDLATIQIFQYPTDERIERELVFAYTGDPVEIAESFYETFTQLYEARETDEFEMNWKQPFPDAEFARFRSALELHSKN